MINFESTKEDALVIYEIAKRAAAQITGYTVMDADMDVTAVHLNGCPLKLQSLLDADRGNFAHDLCGIHNAIDRTTGELQNCFLPRYAQ